MRNSFYILLGLPLSQVYGQADYLMNDANNGQTFTTCSGIFSDDGDINGNYEPNITDRTITFCPEGTEQYLRIDFSSFYIERNLDTLEVFFGDTTSDQPDGIYTSSASSITIISPTPGDCITFRLNTDSSIEEFGWLANISCVTPCSPPIAQFTDDSNIELCSGDDTNRTVNFDVSASASTDSFDIVNYKWHWGDGTTSTTPSPYMSHTFPDSPGWYTVRLEVFTNNTSSDLEGCRSTNLETRNILVLPPPTFDGSITNEQTVACGSTIDLVGVASSQTITSHPPTRRGSNAPLPDIGSGFYESSIDVMGFFDSDALVSSTCLPEVMIDLEHSSASDLEIILISPSGDEVTIFNGYGDSTISDNYLGYCVNETDGSGRGCPAPYYIVDAGGLDWSDPNALTTTTEGCSTYNGTCGSSRPYYIPDIDYNSSNPLSTLVGSPLNGLWRLRIVDHTVNNDGYLASWSLRFPTDCYRDIQHETPVLSDATWTHSGSGPAIPTNQNFTNNPYTTDSIDECPTGETCIGNQLTNDITIGPFSDTGTYTYSLVVTDEFGCSYSYNVDIEVEEGTIIFDNLTDNYCKNDTADTLPTISDNGIVGVWSPDAIDTSSTGTSTYTFTPVDSDCAIPYELTIEVEQTAQLTDINHTN